MRAWDHLPEGESRVTPLVRSDEAPFSREGRKLIDMVASRLGGLLLRGRLRDAIRRRRSAQLSPHEGHSGWRMRMADRIAGAADAERFGIKGIWIIGSVKNGTAGPGSDIDLLIHVGDDEVKRRELQAWLEGWSLSLAETNFLRTGVRTEGLLDAHLITDEDIARQSSFAARIGAVTDAARPLKMQETT